MAEDREPALFLQSTRLQSYSILIAAHVEGYIGLNFWSRSNVIEIVISFSPYLLATKHYVTRFGACFQILKKTGSVLILGSLHKHKTTSIPVLHESKSNKAMLYVWNSLVQSLRFYGSSISKEKEYPIFIPLKVGISSAFLMKEMKEYHF